MTTPTIPPFGLRMRPELKGAVSASAKSNQRSMNAEIVFQLEAAYAAMKAKGPETVAAVPSQVPANHANEKATEHGHE